jgi:phosphate/sulfate permease
MPGHPSLQFTPTAGSNDAQKTAGIVLAVLAASGHAAEDAAAPEQCACAVLRLMLFRDACNMYAVPLWVLLSSNVVIAAGTVYGGWGIIETMGVGIAKLSCSSGFAANVGAVTSIFGATQLGVPISTTHAAAASIMGAGFGDKSRVSLKVGVPVAHRRSALTLPLASLRCWSCAGAGDQGHGHRMGADYSRCRRDCVRVGQVCGLHTPRRGVRLQRCVCGR